MTTTVRLRIVACVGFLLVAGGCKPKPKPVAVTSLQRKEAAALVSEAEFAVSVHDLTRAENLLAQATAAAPDDGDTWIALGGVRVRAGNRSGAKSAYQSALNAFADQAAVAPTNAAAVAGQVYALALLGRVDDARALLAKAQKTQPDNRDLRAFAESKQLDQLLASPVFKETAL